MGNRYSEAVSIDFIVFIVDFVSVLWKAWKIDKRARFEKKSMT